MSFVEEVVSPALRSGGPGANGSPPLCEGFLSYVERRVFPGGCFFVATAAELGARAGRVHDRVAAHQRRSGAPSVANWTRPGSRAEDGA